ncbi:MAG: mechanosensitive ion channel family protein [Sulfolobaceae archaeon]|nr:mechanosensitive ion channel family protein [Sulfolobaceae archaeon]
MQTRKLLAFIVIVIAVIALTAVIVYVFRENHIIKLNIATAIYAALTVIGGFVITNIIARTLKSREVVNAIGPTAAEGLAIAIQIIGYSITAIAVLSLIKVGVTSIIFGGTVTGLVLGYAAQNTLSNIFGGLVVLISRPFSIGDRITITTWQYGLIAPTYPPKYFSTDFLIPGFTGVVTDISLMYTTIVTDDNVPLKIPNSIIVQAAVFLHNEEYRKVRTRYEIPKSIEPDMFINEAKRRIQELKIAVKEPEIRIIETTLTTYVIVVDGLFYGQYEEPIRDKILRTLIDLQNKITQTQQQKS